MGHYAKSLGLRNTPKNLLQDSINYKQELQVNPALQKKEQIQRNVKQLSSSNGGKALSSVRNKTDVRPLKLGRRSFEQPNAIGSKKLIDYTKLSRILNTSEFESGIGPARKKMKRN